MFDEQEVTRLLDDYVDGRLSEDESRKLLAFLDESEDLRERLALMSIVGRLLSSAKLPPVSGEKVMQALREGGHIPERQEETAAPRKPRLLERRAEQSGRRIEPTRREEWNRARPVPRHMSLWPAVVVVIIGLGIGGMLWWNGRTPEELSGSPLKNAPLVPERLSARPPTLPNAVEHASPSATNGQESGAAPSVVAVPAAEPDAGIGPTADLPESAFVDEAPPPSGDGSNEPGFVPPPYEGGVAMVPMGVKTSREGATGTEPRDRPQTPLLFVKLKSGEARYWNATPYDLDGLLAEIKWRAGFEYRKEVKSLDEIEPDPERNPILYMSGHYRFAFTPAQRAKLHKFLISGGMMVFDAGCGSQPFYDSARRELGIIFRGVPLERLSSDHPVFRSYYDIPRVRYGAGVRARNPNRDDNEPWLEGVTIRCRTLAVISRWGMAVGWEHRARDSQPAYASEDAIRLGMNLFSYATGVRGWARQSAHSVPVVDRSALSSDKLFVGQVMYDGEWKTRPQALPLLLRTFNQRTSVPVKLGIKELRLSDPHIFNLPLLYMTGHEGFRLSNEEIASLRKYLANGGFLFAEACCGRRGFDRAFRSEMRRVMPDKIIAQIPADNDVYSVPNAVKRMSVTPSLANLLGAFVIAPRLEGFEINGHYAVIYSPYGMSGSWETSQIPYAWGYNDIEALKLGQNILMYAVTH